MRKLICTLKVIQDNIRILHRNLTGPNFMGTHNFLGDYYEEIDEMADDVIELGISLGEQEPNLVEAAEEYQCIPANRIMKRFTQTEAVTMVIKYFDDLINLFESVRNKVPTYIAAKFDGYQEYHHKESKYKLAHLLEKRDDGVR